MPPSWLELKVPKASSIRPSPSQVPPGKLVSLSCTMPSFEQNSSFSITSTLGKSIIVMETVSDV